MPPGLPVQHLWDSSSSSPRSTVSLDLEVVDRSFTTRRRSSPFTSWMSHHTPVDVNSIHHTPVDVIPVNHRLSAVKLTRALQARSRPWPQDFVLSVHLKTLFLLHREEDGALSQSSSSPGRRRSPRQVEAVQGPEDIRPLSPAMETHGSLDTDALL